MTFSARFPGEATFNIVGPQQTTDRDIGESNNIENGTPAARGSYPKEDPPQLNVRLATA